MEKRRRKIPLHYDTSGLKNKTIRLIEESDAQAFPAEPNRTAENECVYASKLSDLAEWKRRADKLGRPWFITTAARPHEVTGKLIRVFILYVKGGLAP